MGVGQAAVAVGAGERGEEAACNNPLPSGAHGGMKLLVAPRSDPLAQRLAEAMAVRREPVIWLDDDGLFSAPMAYEREGTAAAGFLRAGTEELRLDEVSGVLLRPSRDWWPAPGLDLQDQVFVYHETTAAWFAVLAALEAPVVNRFGLGWWLHDLGYPDELRLALGRQLGLATAPRENGYDDTGRLAAAPLDPAQSIGLYLVADQVVPRNDTPEPMAERLRTQPEVLDRWRRSTGIVFCRLDFDTRRQDHLRHVEVLPPLEDESPTTIDRLAVAMTEVLA